MRRAKPRVDALTRAILRLRSLNGTSSYRRFVIVGIARTGSNLLIDLLNAHTQVLAFGELFRSPDSIGWDVPPFITYRSPKVNAVYHADPLAFLERHVFRRWPKEYSAVGFKLFYYHARQPPHSLVWDYLAKDSNIRILHIKRRNGLNQYYSLQLAHRTNIWTGTGASVDDPPPMRLEIEACQKHFSWVRNLEAECVEFFRSHRVREVYYEDLVANQNREMKGVQHFLDLQQQPVRTKLVRQRRRPLSQAIANYGELKQAFMNTPWAEFFTDSD